MLIATPEEQHFVLSSLPLNRAQERLSLAVVLTLLVGYAIAAGPLSTLHPPRIDTFVPVYSTALVVIDLITAVVLFAQFSMLRSLAVLALASGYLFTALIVIPWMLTFPGAFTPGGLLGAGLQTTNWLYVLWHVGFTTLVLVYALLKDTSPARGRWHGTARSAILSSVAITAVAVCAATILTTAGDPLLPRTMLDPIHFSPVRIFIAGLQILWSVSVLAVLWFRRRTVLDLCLIVVMWAYAIEVYLIAFPTPVRFSMGWYAGRVYGLVSGSLVLFVLVYEITILYGQLLRAVVAERREREARLTTGDAIAAAIAHQIRQPLSAMAINAQAGVRWLERGTPDVDEGKAAFKEIVATCGRATAAVESIRALFRKDMSHGTSFDVNDVVGDALAMAGADLQRHRIAVRAGADQLPPVCGDRIQLQQVVLNLIRNAIDAMAASDGPRILTVRCAVHDDRSVLVSIGDSGVGVGEQDVDRIFNPLFTTKPSGMGMGLAICRSIIEAHHGRIWVAPNNPQGALFQFVLPADHATSAGASHSEQPDGVRPISAL